MSTPQTPLTLSLSKGCFSSEAAHTAKQGQGFDKLSLSGCGLSGFEHDGRFGVAAR